MFAGSPYLTGNDDVEVEVRAWFLRYDEMLKALALSSRSDNGQILPFYSVPSSILGPKADMVMLSPAAIAGYGGVGARLDQFRRDGFESSTIVSLVIRLVNRRAAIVEASWERRYEGGQASVVGAVYAVSRSPEGWRITTVLSQLD